MPSPTSQSADAASWPRWRCLTQAPKTSDIDSLSAPGLALVGEVGGELRDRVRQLVAEHVDGLGEPVEDLCRRRRRRPAGCRPRRRCRSPARSARVATTVAPAVVVRAAPEVGEQGERLGDAGRGLVRRLTSATLAAHPARAHQPARAASSRSPASWISQASRSRRGGRRRPGAADSDLRVDGAGTAAALGQVSSGRTCARRSSRYPRDEVARMPSNVAPGTRQHTRSSGRSAAAGDRGQGGAGVEDVDERRDGADDREEPSRMPSRSVAGDGRDRGSAARPAWSACPAATYASAGAGQRRR